MKRRDKETGRSGIAGTESTLKNKIDRVNGDSYQQDGNQEVERGGAQNVGGGSRGAVERVHIF